MKNLLLYLWIFLLASCRTGSDAGDQTVISVSIIPQQYFIEQLAGGLAEVNVMIPPGQVRPLMNQLFHNLGN